MIQERNLRLVEVAKVTGYSVAALRKMIYRRQLGHRKIGRIIAVPESEVTRMLGEYRPPIVPPSR